MMYQNQPYYGYQPNYYGMNNAVPDNLSQLRINQNQQMQQPAVQAPAPQPAQQSSPIIWVSGEAGAKSYLVAPNTTVMLMDAENSTFYLKSADASGMPLPLRIFDYSERNNLSNEIAGSSVGTLSNLDEKFITREEFERRIASLSTGCKCKDKEKAKKVKEETANDEPFV